MFIIKHIGLYHCIVISCIWKLASALLLSLWLAFGTSKAISFCLSRLLSASRLCSSLAREDTDDASAAALVSDAACGMTGGDATDNDAVVGAEDVDEDDSICDAFGDVLLDS